MFTELLASGSGSGGGGVSYVDYDNQIGSGNPYTATQDCYAVVSSATYYGASVSIKVNDILVVPSSSSSVQDMYSTSHYSIVPLKNGDTIKSTIISGGQYSGGTTSIKIYGLSDEPVTAKS